MQRDAWSERLLARLAAWLVPDALATYAGLEWEDEACELTDPNLVYPSYYLVPHHGFANGYFSGWQALGWDFVERIFRMEHVRPSVLALAEERELRRVVEIGCGTAGTTLALAKRLPEASFTCVDLSPYQLAATRRLAERAGLADRVTVRHAAAEATGLPTSSVDLVVAPLLFHELPPAAARAVIAEAHRILAPGGRLLIVDAIQRALPWRWADRGVNALLATMLREVYWREYMEQPIWPLCRAAGFDDVRRRLIFAPPWIFQAVIAERSVIAP